MSAANKPGKPARQSSCDALYREVRWPQWQRTTCPLPSRQSARAVGGNEDKGPRLGCLILSWHDRSPWRADAGRLAREETIMTQDKARKIAARQRMSETGEPYSVARHAVQDEHDTTDDLHDDSVDEQGAGEAPDEAGTREAEALAREQGEQADQAPPVAQRGHH